MFIYREKLSMHHGTWQAIVGSFPSFEIPCLETSVRLSSVKTCAHSQLLNTRLGAAKMFNCNDSMLFFNSRITKSNAFIWKVWLDGDCRFTRERETLELDETTLFLSNFLFRLSRSSFLSLFFLSFFLSFFLFFFSMNGKLWLLSFLWYEMCISNGNSCWLFATVAKILTCVYRQNGKKKYIFYGFLCLFV